MFGFFWMRHRGMRKVLPRSLALRMHAWQLVLGSTYLQDFVKNGRPANRLSVFISDAIEALWCTWYPQCNCYYPFKRACCASFAPSVSKTTETGVQTVAFALPRSFRTSA
jgi:hypothetical protein